MVAEGDIIAGKFRVERVLGQGGMGVVVAATHLQLGHRVALKFLLPEFYSDAAIAGRFLREARASAQLRSDHICRVSDVGTLDAGAPYIVMELLEGRDLAGLLSDHGPLPISMLADYIIQACIGLAEAHAARIVHRDLKPANLFLTTRSDGTPAIKILDFGIAKAPNDNNNFNLTRTAAVMGSPGYMSPEQLRSSRHADARSDIWALGVILYELASGRPPFVAETITELTLRTAVDPTPRLTAANAPVGFDQVVYRCLEKDPARRFQDVAQLAMALAPFGGPAARSHAQRAARMLSVDPGASASTAPSHTAAPTTLGSSAASIERTGNGVLRWTVVVGVLVVAAMVGIAFLKLRDDRARLAESAAPLASPPADASPLDAHTLPVTQTTPATQPTPASSAALPHQASPGVSSPVDAAVVPPADAAVPPPADAALPSPPGAATPPPPVMRKITRPKPSAPTGSDEDVGGSRL